MVINLQDPSVSSINSVGGDRTRVFWMLGNQCTYSCSYCPSQFHSGSIKYQPTKVIQSTLEILPKSSVMFSGGEPTYHPDFEKIVLEKPSHILIDVISNASRPIAFWERITESLNYVILTYHSEFAIHDRFLATADLVYKTYKKPGRINLIMKPDNWAHSVNIFNNLAEKEFAVLPKLIVDDFGFRSTKVSDLYSAEQLQWISDHSEIQGKNIRVLDKDNKILYMTNSSELMSTNQANFNTWECYVNTQCIYIDADGLVYDTGCAQRKNVGSIYSGFTIAEKPIICNQNFCWSHMDLLIKKIKIPIKQV